MLSRFYYLREAPQKCFQLKLKTYREMKSPRFLTNQIEILPPRRLLSTIRSNNISSFYKGSNIFITGATGFLGKVLLEKLLSSCGGLERVYVLIREKKGLSGEERLKVLLESPVFANLTENNPECLEKVKCIHGDMAEPNLGLSKTDRKLIIDNVNIVFHSAATTRLNDDLQTALKFNTLGTMQMAELCKTITNLKSFIYISTAYTHTHRRHIEEKVYDPPYNPSTIVDCVSILPQASIKMIQQQILGEYGNTYLFSKSLAESVVLEYSKIIPAAIVRPCVVHASWKEPFPEWVEISSGGSMLILQCARGLLKSFFLEKSVIANIVPVDVATNTAITAAWHSTINRSNTMKVYNCASGPVNPLPLGTFMDLIKKYVREYPTVHAMFYPSYIYTNNTTVEKILHYLLHYIPAVILDFYLFLTNRKPRFTRASRDLQALMAEAACALRIPLIFDTTNLISLTEAIKRAEDGNNFDIDMSKENGFDWDDYIKVYVLGVRQYVFKDNISNLGDARIKLNRLYWASKTIQIISATTLIGLIVLL